MLDYDYKSILRVAIPLMGSTFIQSIVLISDSSFLSRYGTLSFDAVGNGGLIYITMFMALAGLNEGTQILIARRVGEKKESFLPSIFGSAMLANILLASSLLLIAWFLLPNFILGNTKNLNLAELQVDYLGIRSFGMIPSILSLATIAYFVAIGKTSVVLISSIGIAVSNIGLDYVLIFGKLGFAEMGVKGAALASTVADCIGALMIFSALIFSKHSRNHRMLIDLNITKQTLRELIKISFPLMLQSCIALLTWTIFFIWIEQMGVFELTVSQNIRSLYFLAFVPILGFGAATKTYISQAIGHNELKALPIIIRRVQLLTMLFLIILFHGALLYPELMISIINPEKTFISESAQTLQFVFFSILLYGFVSVYFFTIAGSGNTRFTFIIELISIIIYLSMAYLFIKVLSFDIYWVWTVEYIYFGSIGLLSVFYLKKANWKSKKL